MMYVPPSARERVLPGICKMGGSGSCCAETPAADNKSRTALRRNRMSCLLRVYEKTEWRAFPSADHITVAVDGHALENSVDALTSSGTFERSATANPKRGK